MNQERVVSLASDIDADFGKRIDFLLEIDKLKTVLRRSRLVDGSRLENTAEHSWHLAMLVLVLAPHAGADVDPLHAMKLLLVHDIVEIDAGDTFAYDVAGMRTSRNAKRLRLIGSSTCCLPRRRRRSVHSGTNTRLGLLRRPCSPTRATVSNQCC